VNLSCGYRFASDNEQDLRITFDLTAGMRASVRRRPAPDAGGGANQALRRRGVSAIQPGCRADFRRFRAGDGHWAGGFGAGCAGGAAVFRHVRGAEKYHRGAAGDRGRGSGESERFAPFLKSGISFFDSSCGNSSRTRIVSISSAVTSEGSSILAYDGTTAVTWTRQTRPCVEAR
jgi:hypothetical protein